MKINEFNQPKKIDEGFLDVLLGPDLGGKLQSPKARHQAALKVFLQDFIEDATVSLENGIESGLIDPTLTATTGGGTPPPASGGTTPPRPGGTPAPAAPAAPKPFGPRDNSAAATMRAARQFNKDVTTAQAAKADVRASNEKLKKDAEIASRKPGFQQDASDRVTIQKARAAGLIAEHYNRLNYIFESILSELDSGDEPMSISDYMTDWFDMFMNGVNWRAKQSIVLPKIKEVEKTYNTDGGKAAIEKLGRLAFAISGPAGRVPAGSKDIPSVASSAAAPASTTKKSKEQIAADLASLKPRERDEVIQQVQKAAR